jgi:hypothetical protein
VAAIRTGSISEEGDVRALEKVLLVEANHLRREKGFSEGLSRLNEHCDALKSMNDRFSGRLLMAQYCIAAKEFVIAEQLLMELDEISLRHTLDVWDPERVIDMLSMMLECKSKLKRKQEINGYYGRLSRLNIMHAYEIKSKIG